MCLRSRAGTLVNMFQFCREGATAIGEGASSDFDGTQLFTQLDSRSWSETSRGLWMGQPEVDSAGATFGFDGSRRVTRRSPQLDSRSSGEEPLTLVSPSYFERWWSARERVPCATPKVFAFALLTATKQERILHGSSGHLTPGHTCSTTLCLERERFLRREFCSRQGSTDHGSVFVVFLFGRISSGSSCAGAQEVGVCAGARARHTPLGLGELDARGVES